MPNAMRALAAGQPVPVRQLIDAALEYWPGAWTDLSGVGAVHEAGRLHLQIDKANHQLGWQPRWPFATTVKRTVGWYQAVHEGVSPMDCCMRDLEMYGMSSAEASA